MWSGYTHLDLKKRWIVYHNESGCVVGKGMGKKKPKHMTIFFLFVIHCLSRRLMPAQPVQLTNIPTAQIWNTSLITEKKYQLEPIQKLHRRLLSILSQLGCHSHCFWWRYNFYILIYQIVVVPLHPFGPTQRRLAGFKKVTYLVLK